MKKKSSIKKWITRYFVVAMFLSMVLYALVNLRETYEITVQRSRMRALVCAENITSLIDNECSLEKIKTSPNGEIFIEAREVIRELCKSARMDYVYVYTLDPEGMSRYYYVCAGLTLQEDITAESEFCLSERPIIKVLPGEFEILNGSKDLQQDYRENKYGNDIVWIYPYYDQKSELKAMIGMEYNAGQMYANILKRFLQDIIPFALLIVVCMMFLLFRLQKRIVLPINALSNSMKLFAQDSSRKPETIFITQKDEIGEIFASYEKMTEDISTYVNNIEALTREKLENDVQLGIARRIQNGLVPEKKIFEGDGFSISAMTQPAKAVGGDFYDCFWRDDGKVCIVMGDVSGKGLYAAIYMSMIKTVIREKMIVGKDPAKTLNMTNDELCSQNPADLFVTVFAAILDPVTGELTYANAGHTYPVLIKGELEFFVPESGIALGLFEDLDLEDHSMTLQPGEGFLLYTDGVTEAVNPGKEFFGTDRLLDAVRDVLHKDDPAKEITLSISRNVQDFCEGSEVFDDMAVLTMFYKGMAFRNLSLEPSSFEEIKKDVFETVGDTDETKRALLACDEALANIIRYSQATELKYLCSVQNGLLRIIFADDGIPFDPTENEIEEKDFDLLENGGMGLNLMRQSAKSMHYERKNGFNILTLNFSV